MELKERIFRTYCSVDCDIMNKGYNIIPSTIIAKYHHCSLYMARKLINELVQEGLLEKGRDGGYDEYSEQVFNIVGYKITLKGRQTQTYKQEKWRMSKGLSQSFGGIAYSYYK